MLPSFSQSRHIVIADEEDKTTLPYATIKVMNKSKGYYADSNGVLCLPKNNADTLFVEYSGYLSSIFIVDTKRDTIFLKRKSYALPEVVVRQLRHPSEIGLFKFSNKSVLCFTTSMEYATKIDLSGFIGYYKVQKIYLPAELFYKKFNNVVCKLHLYKADKNGFPDEDILVEPIILKRNYFFDKDFYTDISDQNIITAEKMLFIGVECFFEDSLQVENSKVNYNSSPIRLYMKEEKQTTATEYNNSFYRIFDSKNYNWKGNGNSRFPGKFSAGLVILQ